MKEDYPYQKRETPTQKDKEFRLGEGKISGYSSVTLGVLSLLAVLAYLYPSYLTTYELRQVYDGQSLQGILKYGMYFSLFFGVLTFWLKKYRMMGTLGILLTTTALLLGGYKVPVDAVDNHRLSLGVDWLILAFMGSALIFITIEKLFPKYKNQVILRNEWGLDLFYFCFNHLAISAIIVYANYHVTHFEWAASASLQEAIQSIPILLQFVTIVICADFVLYWEHRLFH